MKRNPSLCFNDKNIPTLMILTVDKSNEHFVATANSTLTIARQRPIVCVSQCAYHFRRHSAHKDMPSTTKAVVRLDQDMKHVTTDSLKIYFALLD